MNRRDLIFGVVGLASARALASAAQPLRRVAAAADGGLYQAGAPPLAAKPPSNPIRLANGELEVVFDARHGLPRSYRYKAQRLWGETESHPARAIVCKLQPRGYETVALQATSVRQINESLDFAFQVYVKGRPAATFHLRYALADSTMQVTLESVAEAAGFELIEVALPRLVAVREEDGPAWMAEGRNGGSFVRLEEAKAY
ncbi:MAG: hypothetical protein ABSE87_09290, partial [Terracidiphilus sp.]